VKCVSSITHGLLILKEHLDKILAGTKTWEIRGRSTARRGPIALIESKSGHVVGTCEVVDVVGPLTLAELQTNAKRTGFRPGQLPYPTTYAWVVCDARRLPEPVPYCHPPGAVIWVRLETSVVRRLRRAKGTA
jgi:ASCH domain